MQKSKMQQRRPSPPKETGREAFFQAQEDRGQPTMSSTA